MDTISIRSLVKITGMIQKRIALEEIRRASRDYVSFQALRDDLAKDIQRSVSSAGRILQEAGSNPAALGIRSRRAYQWLKFLAEKKNLAAHLDALQRVNLFLPGVQRASKLKKHQVGFSFYNLGSFYQVSGKGSSVQITAQEVLILAPDKVIIAILENALGNTKDRDKKSIQEYMFSAAYQAAREKLEYLGIDKGSLAPGTVYDLRDSFQRVNESYFQGGIPEPHLVWSRRLTHRKFGHYQWDTDTVMLSKSLDQARVPAYVVDYVMFHELLHKKHGAPLVNQRRAVHTAIFRQEEERFQEFDRAQKWLNKLARKRK